MFNFDELSERILKFISNFDWYNLCDDYGNIENDNETKKIALEEIYNNLVNNPEVILNYLKEIQDEME